MSEDSKLISCLKEGQAYLEQARSAVVAKGMSVHADDYVIATATMVGQLAADKVRDCLNRPSASVPGGPPKPSPRARN
jgi:3-deoxy-D-arabino-heptulosonate 7-phosphate (DAHP) synthase